MDTKIGLSSMAAFSRASGPQGNHSTGLSACWRRYGLVSSARWFTGHDATGPRGVRPTWKAQRMDPLPALEGRELGYAAVAAVGAHLRGAGFTRVRLRLADELVVEDLNGRRPVPPALTMPYVKTRCILHGFALARVERAEPIETSDLQSRAHTDLAARTPAAAA